MGQAVRSDLDINHRGALQLGGTGFVAILRLHFLQKLGRGYSRTAGTVHAWVRRLGRDARSRVLCESATEPNRSGLCGIRLLDGLSAGVEFVGFVSAALLPKEQRVDLSGRAGFGR